MLHIFSDCLELLIMFFTRHVIKTHHIKTGLVC